MIRKESEMAGQRGNGNGNRRGGGGTACRIIVTVVLLALIGVAYYFVHPRFVANNVENNRSLRKIMGPHGHHTVRERFAERRRKQLASQSRSELYVDGDLRKRLGSDRIVVKHDEGTNPFPQSDENRPRLGSRSEGQMSLPDSVRHDPYKSEQAPMGDRGVNTSGRSTTTPRPKEGSSRAGQVGRPGVEDTERETNKKISDGATSGPTTTPGSRKTTTGPGLKKTENSGGPLSLEKEKREDNPNLQHSDRSDERQGTIESTKRESQATRQDQPRTEGSDKQTQQRSGQVEAGKEGAGQGNRSPSAKSTTILSALSSTTLPPRFRKRNRSDESNRQTEEKPGKAEKDGEGKSRPFETQIARGQLSYQSGQVQRRGEGRAEVQGQEGYKKKEQLSRGQYDQRNAQELNRSQQQQQQQFGSMPGTDRMKPEQLTQYRSSMQYNQRRSEQYNRDQNRGPQQQQQYNERPQRYGSEAQDGRRGEAQNAIFNKPARNYETSRQDSFSRNEGRENPQRGNFNDRVSRFQQRESGRREEGSYGQQSLEVAARGGDRIRGAESRRDSTYQGGGPTQQRPYVQGQGQGAPSQQGQYSQRGF